jgi:hypothetical protein
MDQKLQRAYDALQQAHDAGNKEDAQQIADHIRDLQNQAMLEAGDESMMRNPVAAGAVGAVAGPVVGKVLETAYGPKGVPTTTPGAAPSMAGAPGQKYAAKTGYGAGTGETVQDVVEEFKKREGPLGKGKVTSKITGGPLGGPAAMESIAAKEADAARFAQMRAANQMAAQKASSVPGRIAQATAGKMPLLLKSAAGAGAGMQGADAYNRFDEGDFLGGLIGGIGAAGSAASLIPHPVTRIGGTAVGLGASALNAYIDYLKGKSQPAAQPQPMATGGLVHLAGGKRALAEEGGSKIMEILKDKMAPLYAKSAGVPARLPRATPKTDAELFEFAQRMSPQVRGDFVPAPGETTSVAGKTRAQFEREKGLQHDIRNVRGLTLKPSNYDEAAHQGKVKVGIAGDQTLTGKDVYGIAGNKLSSPSRQYGGSLYPATHPLGWASEENAAQGVQNLVDTAAKQYGDVDVLGEFMKMGPEANNYAMHNADAIIKSINPAQVKQLDDLNRMIRAKFPDFAGIENQADILKQAEQNPELRKFLDYLVMTKKHAETYGLPSGADIRHALSEPDLRNLEIGASGKSIIEMVPGGKISPSSRKTTTTYSHDIPGDYLGGTKYARPYQLEFADSYSALQNKISNVQDLAKQAIIENPDLDPQTAIQYAKKYANQGFGGFRLAQPRQIMDQQYMDETGKYEDYMKQLLGFKQGGSTTPAWQRSEGKSPSGGLNALGRASYKRETGGELKAPQPEGGSRKKSFCARMGGMKKKLTSSKTANDPDSRINKALRKWKC